MNPTQAIVILVAAPNQQVAKKIAEHIVNKRLAACVNLLPGIRSIYRWQGKIEDDSEILMIIKSRRAKFEELSQSIASMHPYDTPEILALDVSQGSEKYLNWLLAETSA